jgi:hypothetical protein
MMPFLDPPVARHLSAISVAAGVMVGEGHAPLWQYLCVLPPGSRVHCCPKGHGPRTLRAFSL